MDDPPHWNHLLGTDRTCKSICIACFPFPRWGVCVISCRSQDLDLHFACANESVNKPQLGQGVLGKYVRKCSLHVQTFLNVQLAVNLRSTCQVRGPWHAPGPVRNRERVKRCQILTLVKYLHFILKIVSTCILNYNIPNWSRVHKFPTGKTWTSSTHSRPSPVSPEDDDVETAWRVYYVDS